MKRLPIFIVVIALLALVATLGVSCTSTTTPSSTTTSQVTKTTTTTQTTTATSTTTTTATTTTTTTSTSGPQSGGTLKILTTADQPKNMGYPGAAMDSVSSVLGRPAVENLVGMNPDGSGEVVPQLATGWSYSSDYSSLTFTLRKGVKFHDGTDFNATAAKFNLDLGKEAKLPTFNSVSSIEAVDDYTLKLNLSSYDVTLLTSLSFDFTGKMLSPTAVQSLGADAAKLNPVGTGPFKFVSYTPNVSIKFQKFDGYWQEGKPYLDAIEFIVNADPVNSMMSFQAGEAQVIRSITAKDAASLRTSGKYTVLPSFDSAGGVTSGKGALTGTIGIAGDSAHADSPFANIKVRQAISYAIDNAAIAKAVGFGSYLPAYQWFPDFSPAYNSSVVGYPYNVQKGKDLMAEAGYASGIDTTINFMSSSPYPDVYTIVQNDLKQIGITTKLQPLDGSSMMNLLRGGWDDCLIWFTIPGPPGFDPGSAMKGFLSNDAFMFNPDSILIPDDYQAKLTAANSEQDTQKREAMLKELSKMIIDQYCLATPIFQLYSSAAMSDEVQDLSLYNYAPHEWAPETAWLSK